MKPKFLFVTLLLCLLGGCSGYPAEKGLTKARLEHKQGRALYNINGKLFVPILYSPPFSISRSPYGEDGRVNYSNFRDAGIDLVEMHMELRNAWNRDGTLNIPMVRHELISVLEGILEINPDAYFQVRVDFHAPRWWLDRYPAEMVHYARGPIDFGTTNDIGRAPNASLASERWQQEADVIVKQFLDYLQTTRVGKRVFSFLIGGACGSEWTYFGYKQEPDTGDAMTRRFRQWLADKYVTDVALQQAWNAPRVTIATAVVPDMEERRYNLGVFRDPQKERRILDYYHCHQETIESVIDHFTQFFKENWPSDVLVGLFNGYLFSDNDFNSTGYLYFGRLLDSPYIDFFAGPYNYNYDARDAGGTSQPRSLVGSVNLHGKLFMTEQDRITHLIAQSRNNETTFTTDEQSVAMLRTNFAQLVSLASGYWFEEFSGFPGYAPYVAHEPLQEYAGNFNSPALMSEIGRQKRYYDQAVHHDYEREADVAFFYDFDTFYYLAEVDNRQTREIEYASNNWLTADAYRSGVSFDTYLYSDLRNVDLSRYKAVVFGTTYCISDEDMVFINDQVKKDGRLVIFNYAPAYTDGTKLDVRRIGKITEMEVRPIKITTPPVMTILGNHYGLEADGSPGRVPVSPLFEIDDSGVEVLGRYQGSDAVAVARKKQPDYTVVYAALPLRGPGMMRKLFREAGAHIYNDADDVVIAGGGIVCVATREDAGGPRTIHLRNGKQVELDMKPGTTVILDEHTGEILFD